MKQYYSDTYNGIYRLQKFDLNKNLNNLSHVNIYQLNEDKKNNKITKIILWLSIDALANDCNYTIELLPSEIEEFIKEYPLYKRINEISLTNFTFLKYHDGKLYNSNECKLNKIY